MVRTISIVAFVSFLTNFLWENAHAHLYLTHLGAKITEKTLIIATLGDVVILSLFAFLWYTIPWCKTNVWFVIPLGLVVAVAIEKYALLTHRWVYGSNMPLVPYLSVGLSPMLQLACTGMILMLTLSFFDKRIIL